MKVPKLLFMSLLTFFILVGGECVAGYPCYCPIHEIGYQEEGTHGGTLCEEYRLAKLARAVSTESSHTITKKSVKKKQQQGLFDGIVDGVKALFKGDWMLTDINLRQVGINKSPRFMRPFREPTKEKLIGWTDRERGNAVYKPAHIRRKKYRRAGGNTSFMGSTN